jgi:hypothetical protein
MDWRSPHQLNRPVGLDHWIAHFSFYTLRNLPQLTITHSQIIRFPSPEHLPSPFPSSKQPPQIFLPTRPKQSMSKATQQKEKKEKWRKLRIAIATHQHYH